MSVTDLQLLRTKEEQKPSLRFEQRTSSVSSSTRPVGSFARVETPAVHRAGLISRALVLVAGPAPYAPEDSLVAH